MILAFVTASKPFSFSQCPKKTATPDLLEAFTIYAWSDIKRKRLFISGIESILKPLRNHDNPIKSLKPGPLPDKQPCVTLCGCVTILNLWVIHLATPVYSVIPLHLSSKWLTLVATRCSTWAFSPRRRGRRLRGCWKQTKLSSWRTPSARGKWPYGTGISHERFVSTWNKLQRTV